MGSLNWRLTCVAFGCWLVFLPLFSIVHEYGHAYACYAQGHQVEVHMGLLGNYTTCLGAGIEPGTYRMAGGFFGASTSLLIFAILKDRLKGTAKGVAIALVVVGLTQFYNMVVETYFNDFYMTGNINTGINSFMALILLLVLIQRNSRNTIRKIEIVKNQDESKYSEDVPQNIFKRSIVDIIKGRKPLPRNDLPQKPQTSLATLDILKGDNED